MSGNQSILFRCDADARLGFGHLRRCQALAGEMARRGFHCGFLTNAAGALPFKVFPTAFPGVCNADEILSRARQLGATSLVLDHYGANESCQVALRDAGVKWLQFEGTPAQPLWADWVLAASPAARSRDYAPLLRNPAARLLLGPQYAILRPEFEALRAERPAGEVKQLVLTFGGGGDRGALELSLAALLPWRRDVRLHILTSGQNANLQKVRGLLQGHEQRVSLHVDAPDFPALLAAADLAVIAGGMTTFEAAALGVPFVVIEIADNQARNAAAWADLGVAVNMGPLGSFDARELRDQVESLASDVQRRRSMASRGRELVDGMGARRIAAELDT